MKKSLISAMAALLVPAAVHATELTAVPGPDDQGGMIMPMISLTGTTLSTMFSAPADAPDLLGLRDWTGGSTDTFAPTASWYDELDPTQGAQLFNNQYGFTFSGTIPTGKGLGIRLLSSSAGLEFYNYGGTVNRFDPVFSAINSQVLWSGMMWHNYVTIDPSAAAGIYTATFQIFIANTPFTTGTGAADYSLAALAATQDMTYMSVNVNYTWEVIPEPSAMVLTLGSLVALAGCGLVWRRRHAV